MNFNAIQFYKDFAVEFMTEGHQHCTRGWVQIRCPFCMGSGWKLGFNISQSYYVCWGCGYHKINEVLEYYSHLKSKELFELKKLYSSRINRSSIEIDKKFKRKIKVTLPKHTDLTEHDREYLKRRRFDPEKMVDLYALKSTTRFGAYKFRLLIPIYYRNQLISYEARDTYDRPDKMGKYKACPNEEEVIPRKEILYGFDNVPASTCVVVEGVTDVWRLGPGSVATCGISFTRSQVECLSVFEKIYLFFDAEKKAQKQASKLASDLAILGKEVYEIEGYEGKDPADLTQTEANKLMEQIL